MINEYSLLFPEKKIQLGEIGSVKMRPLSISQLNFLAEAFTKVMGAVQNAPQGDYANILQTCYKELMELLPYCLEDKAVLDYVPAGFLPTLMVEFIELNLNQEVLARFLLLWQRIQETVSQIKEISSPLPD